MAIGRIILCVDDEPTVLSVTMRVIRDILPNEEVIGTSDPEEACRILSEKNIAVLVSDLSMPKLDGAAVVKAAFQRNPDTVSMLVTGRASADGLMRAVNEGQLWRCLQKPWAPDAIGQLLVQALEVYEERLRQKHSQAESASREDDSGRVLQSKGHGLVIKKSPPKAPKVSYRLASAKPRQRKLIMDSRYKNMSLIREGGSGSIYKAHDSLLGMTVAIKIIADEIASNAAAMKDLITEARIAMGLSHKHIVRLHNIEQGGNYYYLVMEYIDGGTLRDILHGGKAFEPLTVRQVVDVMEDALGYAHRRGIFHRDIKPDNIMVDRGGVLKIVDFGLACLGESFRRTGQEFSGTPYYMSPEEMACEVPDQRTDIFSLGVMVHELLAGSLPPHGGGGELMDFADYVPIASTDLPEHVRQVLQSSFELERAQRWTDVNQFASAFRQALDASYP